MFAVAFVLFLFGNGCVRDARCQNVARNLEGPDYFACSEQNDNGHPAPLGKCVATGGNGINYNINCSSHNGFLRQTANLTNCTHTGDKKVVYTGCNGTVTSRVDTPGPFDIFVSSCFVHPGSHNEKECGSVNSNDQHKALNCTEVLSEYEKRKPAPTKNDNAPTTEDKKESPKQKQNDSPATRPQRSEVNVTEQNRPTSVERSESREVTTPHTTTSSGTVLLTGLHARVFCALQLLRLLK
ncbi:hypothetical protein ERJ75_000851700 [Trypanosoma vivax]|nr:hypothetical protein ERJ75_001772900 [Trypanosoma vivax]KAH8612809.1 hypothetical protein ERJ75_000851700 [Trypanosoma vivax]